MSRASLKDQLQAVAPHLSESLPKSESQSSITLNSSTRGTPPQKRVSPPAPARPAQKPQWLEAAYYGIELLKAYFPECFKSGTAIRPLKKGIKQDLVKRLSTIESIVLTDKACMIKSLSHYVGTAQYQKQITEGKERIDLEGQVCGTVNAEEAQHAISLQQAKKQARHQKNSPQNS